jgi:adenine/guanine phosphoribosyltransferase-like PRPP-binding protein
VDDVVSTGGPIKALESLLVKTGCKVVAKAAVQLEEVGLFGKRIAGRVTVHTNTLIAVEIVDDRGIESLKIIPVGEK